MNSTPPAPDAYRWELDEGQCIGCGICADVCPERAISLPRDGLLPTWLPQRCSGCGACAVECPTAALRVTSQLQPANRTAPA